MRVSPHTNAVILVGPWADNFALLFAVLSGERKKEALRSRASTCTDEPITFSLSGTAPHSHLYDPTSWRVLLCGPARILLAWSKSLISISGSAAWTSALRSEKPFSSQKILREHCRALHHTSFSERTLERVLTIYGGGGVNVIDFQVRDRMTFQVWSHHCLNCSAS
jgi:hypothetical protein